MSLTGRILAEWRGICEQQGVKVIVLDCDDTWYGHTGGFVQPGHHRTPGKLSVR
jgi:hypothetical protein